MDTTLYIGLVIAALASLIYIFLALYFKASFTSATGVLVSTAIIIMVVSVVGIDIKNLSTGYANEEDAEKADLYKKFLVGAVIASIVVFIGAFFAKGYFKKIYGAVRNLGRGDAANALYAAAF